MPRHAAAGSIVALLAVTLPGSARAEIVEVSPGMDVEAAINALAPGDELVVHGGTYTLSGRFGITVVGTEVAPIVIRAADGERPVFDRPAADQNIWDIDRAEWVTVRGLEFSGGSAGLRISAARDFTIEGCELHDTGDVAVRANDTGARYERMRILRNHIHDTNDTGEGMYLGCNNDGCQVVDSLIEGNWIHHTNGPTVVQGDGIELKEGSYGNTIRDNVIHDTNYPCILTYATAGNGAANVIERNVMWNCGDHAIQSAADAVIRNNIILGAVGSGIAMQNHQAGSPANLEVTHNTILKGSGDAIRASGIVGRVVIANNAVFAQGGNAISVAGALGEVTVVGNGGTGAISGTAAALVPATIGADLVAASYGGSPPNDVFPAALSALAGAGEPAHVASDDFNGTLRAGVADIGAYAHASGGNPGWTITAGFKGDLVGPGAPDAGPGGPGGGADAGGAGAGGEDGAGCCQAPGQPVGAAAVLVGLVGLVLRRRRPRVRA